jgi:hypothetical protein
MADLLPRAPRQRAKRFRDLAREARGYAAKSKDTVRIAFLEIAVHWDQLASEAEAASESAGFGAPANSSPMPGLAEPDETHIHPTEPDQTSD